MAKELDDKKVNKQIGNTEDEFTVLSDKELEQELASPTSPAEDEYTVLSEEEVAEMDFVDKPVSMDAESGYDKYQQLQDEAKLAGSMVDRLKPQEEEEISLMPDLKEKSDVTRMPMIDDSVKDKFLTEDQKAEQATSDFKQKRIVDLQTKMEEINVAAAEQAALNVKEFGFASKEHEAIGKEYENYSSLLDKAIEEKASHGEMVGFSLGGAIIKNRPEDLKKVKNLRNIKELYSKMGKVLGAPQGENFTAQMDGLLHGFSDNFFTKDFATLGLSEMGRLLNVKDAFDTQNEYKAEGKTEAEIAELMPEEQKALLDAYQQLLHIQAGTKGNFGSVIGEGLKEMIPFIAQFAATGGIGTGAKKLVKEFVEAKTKKAVAGRIAGVIAKPMVQAAAMVPAELQNYAQRVAPTMDAQGELIEGEAPINAAFKAYITTVAEVAGEDVGVFTNKWANKAARKNFTKLIANNPDKAQMFLGKMSLALTRETNMPGIQGFVFEGIGEEATGIMQAAIDNDGNFFTMEAQKQIWAMSLMASGGFAAASVPGRLNTKMKFNKSVDLLNDIPNADYAKAAEDIAKNYTDAEESLNALDAISKDFDISEEDYLKARNFIGSSAMYNQMNTARALQVEERIAQSIGKDGNVTMTQVDGKAQSIRNPQDLGKGNESKVIYMKSEDGTVRPIISSKITTWETKSPDDIITEFTTIQDQSDEAFQQQQRVEAEAIEKGLVEGNTVETPNGKRTFVSINVDGTAVVTNDKGEEEQVNISEIEVYKTQETKDIEKEEVKKQEEADALLMEGIEEGSEITSDEPLTEESEIRVVDFSNGQSKIITPEGETIYNTPEERDAAIGKLASGEIDTAQEDLDSMPPEQAFNLMRKDNPEIAIELFTSDIQEMRDQAEDARAQVKESKSRKEKQDLLVRAKQLENEAVRLDAILAEPLSVEDASEQLNQEYLTEQEQTPFNQLTPWQQDLVGMKVGRGIFVNTIGTQAASDSRKDTQQWFISKAKENNSHKIDNIAEVLSESHNTEVTVQDIVDFILENPTNSVRKTTNRMTDITTEYRDLTGKSIKTHTQAPVEVAAEVEGIGEVEEVSDIPFRTEGVNVTERAQEDIKNRQNAIKELNKLQEKFGIPIEVINSDELSPEAKAKAREVGSPKAFYQTGIAYILSDQITSVSDVKKSYMHEAILHKGLDVIFEAGPVTLLGKTYETKNDLLDDAYKRMDAETIADRAKIYANIPVDQLTEVQQRELAEEALATLNETESPRLQVMLDKLHKFIKKLFGFSSKQFSKADLRNLLREHRDLVIAQKKGADVSVKGEKQVKFRTEEGVLVSPEELIKSPNFKEWSNNAPYVSSDEAMGHDFKTGSPVVVEAYHGGYAAINSFDENFAGETTADNEFGAFYFSSDKDVADDYSKESMVRRYQDNPESLIDSEIISQEEYDKLEEEGVDWYEYVDEFASDPDNQNVVEGFVHFDNPLVVDAGHEGLRDLEKRFNIQEALGFISGRGVEIPESVTDELLWDQDEVDNYKDEIEERARENNGLEEDEEIEDYMIDEATNEIMEQEGFEQEYPEYDGLIITNVIDDIGEGSQDFQNLYISVNPNQIKSQDNRGTFDRYNQYIRFRVAESKQELDDFVKDSKVKETVYHGTNAEFDEFTPSSKRGMYFSTNKKFAETYGENIIDAKLDMKNMIDVSEMNDSEIIDALPIDKRKKQELRGAFRSQEVSNYQYGIIETGGVLDAIKNEGYDGIKYNEGYSDNYIAFEPSQILIEPKEDVRSKVDEAAEQVETDPSDAQKESGNYKMGHVKFDGFDVSIENPKGSIRSGVNQEGEKWSNIMPANYGYFKNTIGADKDHIDTFMGDNMESDKVYVVDQVDPVTGKFDEHKVMMGYNSLSEARNAYNEAYDEDWKGLGAITRTTKDGLKEWFKGNTKKPFAPDVKFRATSTNPEVQKMLDRLQAVQDMGKAAERVKGLEAEAKQTLPLERQSILTRIEGIKEGAKIGAKDTKELIKEAQKIIAAYTRKTMPLGEAGARDIGSLMTTLIETVEKADTPEAIEKAFERIDELTGQNVDKIARKKHVSKVNRILKWMTGLKKSGTKKVGKFNYTDSKQFQELKDINKQAIDLVKKTNSYKASAAEKAEASAQLETMWNDINEKLDKNSLDDVMMKLIELRRLGSKASPKLAQIVSEELEAIYLTAKEAKSQVDMIKGLERWEKKEFVKDFLRDDSIKKKNWFQKANRQINSKTADVMGNWETLMTMIGGYELRDDKSFLVEESQIAVGKQESSNKLLDKAKEIYGSKSKTSTLNKIHSLAKEEYELRRPNEFGKKGEGDAFEISKLDLMDIYNATQNERIRDDYYMSYGDITLDETGKRDLDAQYMDGKKRIDALLSNLENEDIELAQTMKEIIGSYRAAMNDIHIKLYNRDMQDVGEYWPSTAQRQKDIDPMAQMSADYRYASSLQSRMEHRTPVPSDAFNKFTKHIEEAEWMINMAIPFKQSHDIFKDNQVRALLDSARGEKFTKLVDDALVNTTLNSPAKMQQKSELHNLLNPVLNNWVTSKIGLTPTVPVKQLLSAVNYAENMPAEQWVTGLVKGLISPKDTWRQMMEIPYLKARLGNGYSEAIQRALNGDDNVHQSQATNYHQAFKNLMTIGTRYGDITAIVFGGKPYMDYLIKEGMKKEGAVKEEVEKEAVDKFLQDTLRSQQSPFSSSLSKLQNSKNPFFRAVFAFANTPSQYMRKLFEANQNYRVQKAQFNKGKITQEEFNKVKKQTAKAHTIYGLINTVSFTAMGALMQSLMRGADFDDDLLKDMIVQLEQTFIGGLPIIKDIVGAMTKSALGLKVYDDSKPFIEGIDQMADAGIKLLSGSPKNPAKEYDKIGQGLATMFAVPYYNIKKTIKAIPPYREETFRETRVKEVGYKLNDLKKDDDIRIADAAKAIAKSYSSAKRKAKKLKGEGKHTASGRITKLIEKSKIHLWKGDYSVGDMKMELKMFDKMVDRIE